MRHKLAYLLMVLLAGSAASNANPSESGTLLDSGGVQRIVGDKVVSEFAIDLNEDGVNDRLIAPTNCGNAGCTYLCFVMMADDKFRFVGELFVHRRGFEVLKTKHNGLSDLLSYSRSNASEGSLLRHEFDGQQYQITARIAGSSGLYDLLRPSNE